MKTRGIVLQGLDFGKDRDAEHGTPLRLCGCQRHLACLEEKVEELDAEILRRMQLSTFQKAFTLLQTIPGVGQLSEQDVNAKLEAAT